MRWLRGTGASLLAAVFFVASTPATALAYGDQAAVEIEHLRPAPGNARLLSVDLAKVDGHHEVVFQSFIHYADQPLVYCQAICPQSILLAHRMTLDLSLAWSLLRRLQLAFSLPVILYQYNGLSDDLAAALPADLVLPSPAPAGIGDVRLHAKVTILSSRAFGLGLAAALSLPTGDGNSFLGTRLPSLALRAITHLHIGRFTGAINVGFLFAASEQVLALESGMALLYSIGLQLEVLRDRNAAFYLLAEAYGQAQLRFASATDFPTEFLVASKTELRRGSLFVGVGSGLISGYGVPNVRILAGFSVNLRRPLH